MNKQILIISSLLKSCSNIKLAHRFYATNVTNQMVTSHRARLFEEEKQRQVDIYSFKKDSALNEIIS